MLPEPASKGKKEIQSEFTFSFQSMYIPVAVEAKVRAIGEGKEARMRK